MRSPAIGLAWALWRQHRWGAAAILIYLLGIAAAARALPASLFPREAAVATAIPLLLGLVYLMAAFANTEADVAAAFSGYPSHAWVLPVRTRDLVVWPMLFGSAITALAWIAAAGLIFIPRGLVAPVAWPAAMLASLLAWLQAICWYPLGVPYLRIFLALTVLPVQIALGIAGHLDGLSSALMTGMFLALTVLAYPFALAGVSRARRGDSHEPGWLPHRHFQSGSGVSPVETGPDVIQNPESKIQNRFPSPAHAQLWLEVRRHGFVLPLLVTGACLLFSLPLIWVRETLPLDPTRPPAQPGTGIGSIQVSAAVRAQMVALLIPLLLGMIVGCGLRRSESRRQDLTLDSFLATRPLSSGSLVLAKLRMAALSALLAWVVMLLFIAAWLLVPAWDGGKTGPLGVLLLAYLTPKGGLVLLLILAGLVGLTWKLQVEGLWIDYTGRRWLINSAGIAAACLLTAGLWFLAWLGAHPHLIPYVLDRLPRLAALALVLKLFLGAGALYTLWGQRILPPRTLAMLVAGWLLLALALYLLLQWLLPPGFIAPRYLALGILLILPLARLALAPLALAWNRHR